MSLYYSQSVYVSLASGNVFAFTAGQVQLLRDAVAPIAGLTVAGSLVRHLPLS